MSFLKKLFLGLLVFNAAAFEFDEINFDNFDQAVEPDIFATATRAKFTPADIIALLEQFGAIDLLKEDFFLRSSPLNRRSLLDYPLFMFPWDKQGCTTHGYQIFYNQTSAMVFSGNCTKISSYLAIFQGGFAEKLQEILNLIKETAPDFDPEVAIELLTLFEHFTVQERRLGCMFNFEYNIDDWRLWFYFPFYWNVRNHFVTPEVQNALEHISEPLYGTPCQIQQDAFTQAHLIDDRIGFGDFRFEFDYPVCCFPWLDSRLGFFTTIPTALPIGGEILGTNLHPPCRRQTLNFSDLFDNVLAGQDISESEVATFFTSALDNLSAILLDSRLGNNGHIGLGVTFKTFTCLGDLIKRPWAQEIQWRGRFSAEWLTPRQERRFFIPNNNAAAFRNFDFNNEDQASKNLDFLMNTLTDRLFPQFQDVTVYPGLILRSTSRAIYYGEKWSFFLGTDMWIQTGDTIIQSNRAARQIRTDVKKSQTQLGYQSKLMAGISRQHVAPETGRTWTFSLNADSTYYSSGIGQDFMITCNMDVNF